MFSAQLDTSVLVPSLVRDVLLEVAERGVYRPLWSSQILDELARAVRPLLAKRGHDDTTIETYLSRLVNQMETAFPDAQVDDWETLVPTIELPDPDDRHVVAAAVRGRADVIVTDNLKDFPEAALPNPLVVQSADAFLLDALDLYPEQVTDAVRRVASRTGRNGPPLTALDIADQLQTRGTPEFGRRVRAMLTGD